MNSFVIHIIILRYKSMTSESLAFHAG